MPLTLGVLRDALEVSVVVGGDVEHEELRDGRERVDHPLRQLIERKYILDHSQLNWGFLFPTTFCLFRLLSKENYVVKSTYLVLGPPLAARRLVLHRGGDGRAAGRPREVDGRHAAGLAHEARGLAQVGGGLGEQRSRRDRRLV